MPNLRKNIKAWISISQFRSKLLFQNIHNSKKCFPFIFLLQLVHTCQVTSFFSLYSSSYAIGLNQAHIEGFCKRGVKVYVEAKVCTKERSQCFIFWQKLSFFWKKLMLRGGFIRLSLPWAPGFNQARDITFLDTSATVPRQSNVK